MRNSLSFPLPLVPIFFFSFISFFTTPFRSITPTEHEKTLSAAINSANLCGGRNAIFAFGLGGGEALSRSRPPRHFDRRRPSFVSICS